jgi:hypothetical protein
MRKVKIFHRAPLAPFELALLILEGLPMLQENELQPIKSKKPQIGLPRDSEASGVFLRGWEYRWKTAGHAARLWSGALAQRAALCL